MDQNQKLNKPFRAPKTVEPSQSPLQLMFKPSLDSLTFENATLSSKSVPEQPVKKQAESKCQEPKSKCQEPKSKHAQLELKEEYEELIDESPIVKSTTANQTENSNDDDDKEAESYANSAEENQSSQNSSCQEDEVCFDDKRAVIKEHILDRRKQEKNIIEEKRYQCTFCPKQYNHLKTLNDHVSNTHSIENEDQFLCKHCTKGYKTQEGRDNHEQLLCPNRPNSSKKRKSPYQSQIDSQYSFIMSARNKSIKKN